MSYKAAGNSKSKVTAVFGDDAREYLVDSGASFHLVSKETLTDQERSTIFQLRHPIPCQTANGEVLITEKVRVYIRSLKMTVVAALLDLTVSVLSMGVLCDEEGFDFHWWAKTCPYLEKGNLRVYTQPQSNTPLISVSKEGDSVEVESSEDLPKEASGASSSDTAIPPPPKPEANLRRPPKKRSRG